MVTTERRKLVLAFSGVPLPLIPSAFLAVGLPPKRRDGGFGALILDESPQLDKRSISGHVCRREGVRLERPPQILHVLIYNRERGRLAANARKVYPRPFSNGSTRASISSTG